MATKFTRKEKSVTTAVIGSGVQARTQMEGICVIRDVVSVKVFSPNPEHRWRYVSYMFSIFCLSVQPLDTTEEVVRGSDLLVTATSSREPVVNGTRLKEVAHINAVGSARPSYENWMARQ